MSQETVVRCDECGAMKGTTNHWWAVLGTPLEPKFATAAKAAGLPSYDYRLDYCGQHCVTKAFNRWLSTGSVLQPTPTLPVTDEQVDELTFVEQAQDLGDELNAWDEAHLDPLNTESVQSMARSRVTTTFPKVAQ